MGRFNSRYNRGSTLSEFSAIIFALILVTAISLPVHQRNVNREKLAEADASLACIRTQLKAYYTVNGHYPMQESNSFVMEADWNELTAGALEGKYFYDYSYVYSGHQDGKTYKIVCKRVNDEGYDRALNETGTYTCE